MFSSLGPDLAALDRALDQVVLDLPVVPAAAHTLSVLAVALPEVLRWDLAAGAAGEPAAGAMVLAAALVTGVPVRAVGVSITPTGDRTDTALAAA